MPSVERICETDPEMPEWPAICRWEVVGADDIDGVELRHLTIPGHYALAHRSTSPDRATYPWQVTWFDDLGPGGDVRRRTLEVALYDGATPYAYEVTTVHVRRSRENGAMSEPKKAMRMFRRFHTREPRGIGTFPESMKIPETALVLGPAVNVLYNSDKLNPLTGEDEGWINYIHEHSNGVHAYHTASEPPPGGVDKYEEVLVPAWIRNATELTWFGECAGFAYRDEDGREVSAKSTKPLPELYSIPSGKALLVIQGKRRVLALLWGGRLAVERRGIIH